MSVCGNKWCHRILWLFCLVLLIVGACFISLRQGLFDGMVLPNMVLVPGTALYPKWKDFPLPVITSVYFFNVTNSKDFMDHGAKPILEVTFIFPRN